MTSSQVKDPGLSARLEEPEIAWLRYVMPITEHYCREIEIDWLYRQPHQLMRPHVERFDLNGRHIFLPATGSLLNLAAGTGAAGADLFDLYTAVMLRGISWLFDGGAEGAAPGVQPYPSDLEQEIARLSVKLHGEVS